MITNDNYKVVSFNQDIHFSSIIALQKQIW